MNSDNPRSHLPLPLLSSLETGSNSIAQAGFELVAILLPLPPSVDLHQHTQAALPFFRTSHNHPSIYHRAGGPV